MEAFGLGYVKDAHDERDHMWRSAVLLAPIPLPKKHTRKRLGRVLNQGNKPHCVAFSCSSLKMHQEKRQHGKYYNFDPAWLYAQCKQRDGIPNQDGTFLRVALDVMAKQGHKTKGGAFYKVGKYVRLDSVRQIKEAIYTIGPVVFGITVDTQIYEPNARGIVGQPNDDTVGGHAMEIVGYDDTLDCGKSTGAFLVKNSWGAAYGCKGYIWLPYTHFTHYDGWDAWRCLDV